MGQMYLTCLEVEVGRDRHCGFLPNGNSLSFLVFLPCSSDREADKGRYFPSFPCGQQWLNDPVLASEM